MIHNLSHWLCVGVPTRIFLVERRQIPRLSGRRCSRRRALVPVTAGSSTREAPASDGREIPQLVLDDRATQADPLVEHVDRLVRLRRPLGLELRGQVGTLERRVRVEAVDNAAERVSTFLRDGVDDGAIGVRVGLDAAGLCDKLLDRERVNLVAAVARAVFDPHAVKGDLRPGFSMEVPGLRVAATDIRQAAKAGRDGNEVVHVLHAEGERRQCLGVDR